MVTPGADSLDEDLWSAAVTGDRTAFGEIFDRHCDAVLTLCTRRLGSREDAEDVTSTVFLEAWRCAPRVRFVDGSMRPWLLVVASNLSHKHLRSALRRQARTMRAGATPVEPDFADDTAERMDRAREVAHLVRCLDQLSAKEQAVVSLCDLGGLTYADAAAALRVPIGTVRSRLSRAHARLRHLVISTTPARSLTPSKVVSHERP